MPDTVFGEYLPVGSPRLWVLFGSSVISRVTVNEAVINNTAYHMVKVACVDHTTWKLEPRVT
jgi:hypothetical protein